ncbi:type VI secretion system Vgr family protein [Burkholderia stagnalis]|uniref:Type VI secretion system tip protein VgrG n=1 Tax=Burkholderia stagnalis TaxID=1503054 RepID=A0A6L3N3V7_9BURK|nr:type VI secretion system Vgr family protein [Burkholderia stagnalis]KAB0641026.1 type VI secretion system tip protein VgrG [Burkholderia stagnalis]VWB77744.1 VgrG protein [Burkholderia stagnalis]
MSSGTFSTEFSALTAGDRHRFYRLEVPQARSAEQSDVFEFHGVRAIGESTKYVICFTHPRPDLSRAEYLNKPATFVIQPPHDPMRTLHPEPRRRVQGVITGFARVSHSRDETTYEITLESRLALLRNTPKCRFFLDMSFPQIIEQILREHEFGRFLASFEFNLYRDYGKRPFIMQWQEDDLTFITRLCRRSGIWFVCEEGKHWENVRFGDDLTHYRHPPSLTVPYEEYGGMLSNGIESVSTLSMRSTTIPAQYQVRDYNPNTAYAPIDATNTIRDDPTTYGDAFTWGSSHQAQEDAAREALLRREAALAEQIQFHGSANLLDLTPSSVLKLSNHTLEEAKHGLLAVRVVCSASRKQAYRVEFDAIPSDRFYRLPLLEHAWPKVQGTITGRIAATPKYRGPYLDTKGRYVVQLHLDMDDRVPGLNSCEMRLAKPFAGPNHSGFHFGLVEGTEVTVAFHNGNPDFPYISQVLHNSEEPDPIVAGYPWGTRNTIRTRSNNTFEMDDREGKEHIKVATEHGKSQLNLGYTVDRDNRTRGEGFELRTDMQGSVRAGGGVFVSADSQPAAKGVAADMRPASDQFRLTQAEVQQLAELARTATAEVADLRAENAWLREAFSELQQSVIALSAPNGIGMATPNRVMVSAGKDVSVSASGRFNVSAMRNIVMAAKNVVSVFAHQMGIRLLAARGNVTIQAQSDGVDIASRQDTSIRSTSGRVVIEAKSEILLKCGGSYMRITPNNLTNATLGDYVEKAVAWEKRNPDGTMKKDTLPFSTDVPDLHQHGSRFSG